MGQSNLPILKTYCYVGAYTLNLSTISTINLLLFTMNYLAAFLSGIGSVFTFAFPQKEGYPFLGINKSLHNDWANVGICFQQALHEFDSKSKNFPKHQDNNNQD